MTEFWKDRSVFVTGCTGLVGSWLVADLMQRGARVTGLVRDWVPQSKFVREGWNQRINIVHGQIEDLSTLQRTISEYEVDTVFHLAAQTIVGIANRDPLSTFEANVRGTWNLLEACRQVGGVRSIIVASSDKAYGSAAVLPYNEATPLQGQHPYDVSKSCADLIAQTYAVTYGLPVGITRCGNFYGGGDLNWNRIIPSTVYSILHNQTPVIRSDGHYIRDYFYVEDGVAAYTLLAEQIALNPELRGHAFNFSTEIQVTVLNLVQKIMELMNTRLELDIRGEASKEIRYQYLDASKAREKLNWKPLFTLEEGLQKTILWYQEYFLSQAASSRFKMDCL